MKNNIIDIKRSELNAIEPVSLDEAKKQCIVTYDDDDDLIYLMISIARKAVENYCNISLVNQTVVLTADLYNEWELPYGPVVSITSVQTRGANTGSGPVSYTTATTNWQTDGSQFLTFIPPGAENFNPNSPFQGYFSWGPWASPYGVSPGLNRYRITYTTGWGTDAIPDDLRQAVLMQIAWLYEHRGDEDANRYNWLPGVCEASAVYADKYKRQSWQ